MLFKRINIHVATLHVIGISVIESFFFVVKMISLLSIPFIPNQSLSVK